MINQHRVEEHSHSHTALPSYLQPITSLTPLLDVTQPCQGSNVLTSCPAFSTNHIYVCLSIWHQPSNPPRASVFTLHATSTSKLPTDYPQTHPVLPPLPFEPVILLIRPTANWAWNNFCSRVTAAHLHHFVIHSQEGLMGRRKCILLMLNHTQNSVLF